MMVPIIGVESYDLRITNALLYQLSYIGPARGVHERESRGKRLELSGRCVNSQWNQLPILHRPFSFTHEWYRRRNQSTYRWLTLPAPSGRGRAASGY